MPIDTIRAAAITTNMGVISWRMKNFWDTGMAPHWMKIDGKIGCAFSSAGGWGGGMELACQSVLTVLRHGIASEHPSLKLALRRPPHG